MNRRSAPLIRTAAVCSTAMLAGCMSPLNQEREIGGMVRMNTVVPEDPQQPQGPFDGSPGVDRSDWTRRNFNVPISNTYHEPIYTRGVTLGDTRRERGEYPTVGSALQTSLDTPAGPRRNQQMAEALIAPFAAMTDIVLFIPRAIGGNQPADVVSSPVEPYARSSRLQSDEILGFEPDEAPERSSDATRTRSGRRPVRENEAAVPPVVDLTNTPAPVEAPTIGAPERDVQATPQAPAPVPAPTPEAQSEPDRLPAIREVDPNA